MKRSCPAIYPRSDTWTRAGAEASLPHRGSRRIQHKNISEVATSGTLGGVTFKQVRRSYRVKRHCIGYLSATHRLAKRKHRDASRCVYRCLALHRTARRRRTALVQPLTPAVPCRRFLGGFSKSTGILRAGPGGRQVASNGLLYGLHRHCAQDAAACCARLAACADGAQPEGHTPRNLH